MFTVDELTKHANQVLRDKDGDQEQEQSLVDKKQVQDIIAGFATVKDGSKFSSHRESVILPAILGGKRAKDIKHIAMVYETMDKGFRTSYETEVCFSSDDYVVEVDEHSSTKCMLISCGEDKLFTNRDTKSEGPV